MKRERTSLFRMRNDSDDDDDDDDCCDVSACS